ncbi:hypothetical protein AAY473_034954, partial [Plecturocebus cupreus]
MSELQHDKVQDKPWGAVAWLHLLPTFVLAGLPRTVCQGLRILEAAISSTEQSLWGPQQQSTADNLFSSRVLDSQNTLLSGLPASTLIPEPIHPPYSNQKNNFGHTNPLLKTTQWFSVLRNWKNKTKPKTFQGSEVLISLKIQQKAPTFALLSLPFPALPDLTWEHDYPITQWQQSWENRATKYNQRPREKGTHRQRVFLSFPRLEHSGVISAHRNLRLLCSKMRFPHVGQAGLELPTSGDLPPRPPKVLGLQDGVSLCTQAEVQGEQWCDLGSTSASQ